MSQDKLKTAIIGLNPGGKLLLQAAVKAGHFQIIAVADKDTKLTEQIAQKHNCTPFDDYRQLVIQNNLECLLVAAPIYSCDEYVKAAIKKKCNIFKLAPLARDFEEAAEIVSLARHEKVKLAVANPLRFAQSFLALRQYLQSKGLDKISLITAECPTDKNPHPAWQTDPKLSGGGVLLNSSYQLIDQILLNFPLPEQVYSLNTNLAADRQQRLYLTEDTSVLTMKFTENLFGNLLVSKLSNCKDETLKLFSQNEILTIQNSSFTIEDDSGKVIKRLEYNDTEPEQMSKSMQNFALSILSPEKNKLYSSGLENLKNMAVIESAYLSARTGMPEEPGRIIKIEHIELT
ncbi:MAG: Gfo/Idh/MocA family protein [Planctomycetota bacterium]